MSKFAPRTAVPLLMALIAMIFLSAATSARGADAPPITIPYDHLSTGFELDGVHRDVPCESCHLNALFKGTPRNCGVCHIRGSTFNAMPKILTHIQTTNNCAACHDTISFRPYVHFDHHEVMGNCVVCHNGVIAQGEGPAHPKSSNTCEACHTTLSWNPPKAVDHAQIPLAVQGFCIICHNGVQAAGKPANHIATNLECGDCHLATTWLAATFDHKGIVNNCASCHNGSKAVGKQGNHMPTTNTCESCHTAGIGTKTPSWAPAVFDHTQMTVTTCQTCHSGRVKISTGFVSGQPTNHLPPDPSSIDCGVCHGNTPAAETWAVLAGSIATLHTGLSTNNCVMCHAGQTFAGVPAPYIPMSISGVSPTRKAPLAPPHIPILAGADCSGCHGAAYSAGGFGPATAMSAAKHAFVSTACNVCHDTGKIYYVGGGTPLQLRPADHHNGADPRMGTGDCSLCHTPADWNSTLLPAGHMPNPGNQGCAVCHTGAPSNYKTFAASPVLHTGITGNCAQCHGATTQLSFYNNDVVIKDGVLTPAHIPYLATADCSACHSSTTYAVGGFGPTNMNAAKHTFVPRTCDTCHEAGLNFYLGASTPLLQGRPADHISSSNAQRVSGDCSGCHSTTDWNSTAMPAGHMPNPANQACSVCHTSAPSNYKTLAANPVLHTGISSGCITCHGAPNAAAPVFYPNFTPKAASGLVHIPTGATPCEDCHSASKYTSFSGTSMSAAKHSLMFAYIGGTCNACHNRVTPTLSFYGVTNLTIRPTSDPHNAGKALTNDCNGCHNPNSWGGGNAVQRKVAATATKSTVGQVVKTGAAPRVSGAGGALSTAGRVLAAQGTVRGVQARMSHSGVLAICVSCHNGVLAAGKGPGHVVSNNACENCHTTLAWLPARFEHRGVTASCASCHNGVQALGKPTRHVQTTQDCTACHGTLIWAVATFSHLGVTAACQSCHNGITATAKQAGHVSTLLDCGTCHNTLNWSVTKPAAPLRPLIRKTNPRAAAVPRGGSSPLP